MNNNFPEHELEEVDRTMAGLRDVLIPPGPPQDLVDATLEAMNRQSLEHQNSWRAWFTRPMRIAAALLLGVALVAGIIVIQQSKPQRWALAAVIEKAQQTRSVSFDMNHNSDEMIRLTIRDGDWALAEIFRSGGLQQTTTFDLKTGKSITINHQNKSAAIMSLQVPFLNLYEWFTVLAKGSEKRLGLKQIAGREAIGFDVTHPSISPDGPRELRSKVWVDIETNLPVLIEMRSPVPGGAPMMIENIRFNLPESEIADARFDLKIPESYKVQDMGGISRQDLKPPPTTQQAAELLTLKPGVGIGPLKFGDPKARVIEVLGPPEGGSEIDLHYPSKGLALLVHPKVGLLNIVAHTKKAVHPFVVNDFVGQTEQGIAMGATREQIEAAYGKPDGVQDHGNQTVLTYDANDLTLTLRDGELVQMLMMNPNPRKSATTQP